MLVRMRSVIFGGYCICISVGTVCGCAKLPLRWEFTKPIQSHWHLGDGAVTYCCRCFRDHQMVKLLVRIL